MSWETKTLIVIVGIVLGIYAAFQFISTPWTPLLTDTPHEEVSFSTNKSTSFKHISEKDKRVFFRTLYETYESKNPRSEVYDVIGSQHASNTELEQHYAWFDHVLKQVRATGCPTKQVVVPTRWLNEDAFDRVFQVFDVEQCQ